MSHLHARLWTLVYGEDIFRMVSDAVYLSSPVTLALFALISAQDIQSRAQEGQAHDRTIRSEAPWQEAEAENDTQCKKTAKVIASCPLTDLQRPWTSTGHGRSSAPSRGPAAPNRS